MSTFLEQIRLAEMAAENIYFARLDRELIESLHERMQERMQEREDPFRPYIPPPMGPENIPKGVTHE